MAKLESPTSADELYRYRGDAIPPARPVFQGDVFRDVEIRGLDEDLGLAIVVTHGCSMREGPVLRPRLVVARVAHRSAAIPLPWTGSYRLMPLPDLIQTEDSGSWAASFEDLGSVPSESLRLDRRVACLDDRGVVLLQQRHAHHLTRYVVESEVLYEQSANVLTEAELLEDWLTAAVDEDTEAFSGRAAEQASEFDAFIGPIREDLKDPSRRAAVRRTVRQEIQRRFARSPRSDP